MVVLVQVVEMFLDGGAAAQVVGEDRFLLTFSVAHGTW